MLVERLAGFLQLLLHLLLELGVFFLTERLQEFDLERTVGRAFHSCAGHFHVVLACDEFFGLDLVGTVEDHLGTVFFARSDAEEQAFPSAIHDHVLSLLLVGLGEDGRAIIVQNPDRSVVYVLVLVLSLNTEHVALHIALEVRDPPDSGSRASARGWV